MGEIMSIAQAQAIAGGMSASIWDGTSPINGCSADVIRREYPGDAIYLICDDTGRAVVIQHCVPGAPGHVPMTAATAQTHSASHLAHMRERIMARPMTQLRSVREPMLVAADIAILRAEDAGSDAAALRAYRQALRDVTEGLADPADVVWPEMPA